MKFFVVAVLLAFVVAACASKLPSAQEVKSDNTLKVGEEQVEVESASANRNKRGLLYSAYSAPYAAAYAYPYTASYSYPYAYSSPYVYAGYYPSYYSSYFLG